jgi:hypothetical protein
MVLSAAHLVDQVLPEQRLSTNEREVHRVFNRDNLSPDHAFAGDGEWRRR